MYCAVVDQRRKSLPHTNHPLLSFLRTGNLAGFLEDVRFKDFLFPSLGMKIQNRMSIPVFLKILSIINDLILLPYQYGITATTLLPYKKRLKVMTNMPTIGSLITFQ